MKSRRPCLFFRMPRVAACGSALMLVACATTVPPAWQSDAFDALERYRVAYFSGDTRTAEKEFVRAKTALSATGRIDLAARAALIHCGHGHAALDFDHCSGVAAWREDMAEALRPLISTWFDVLVSSLLSLPPDEERRIWFFLDELASMERLSSLEDGLTKGAKHGGRFVCGLQSTAQLDDIYTKDKATVLRSCFRNLLVLNIPNTDPATAEEFSRGLGEREYKRKETSKSLNYQRGPTRTVSERYVRERAVLPVEIHALADLTGYLKFAGDYPIAKVKLAPRDYPRRRPAIREA